MNKDIKNVIEKLNTKTGYAVSSLLNSNILYKDEFTNEIINSTNPFYIYNAVKYIKGLDLNLLGESIVKLNNLDIFIYLLEI